jgi:hypothetical protein
MDYNNTIIKLWFIVLTITVDTIINLTTNIERPVISVSIDILIYIFYIYFQININNYIRFSLHTNYINEILKSYIFNVTQIYLIAIIKINSLIYDLSWICISNTCIILLFLLLDFNNITNILQVKFHSKIITYINYLVLCLLNIYLYSNKNKFLLIVYLITMFLILLLSTKYNIKNMFCNQQIVFINEIQNLYIMLVTLYLIFTLIISSSLFLIELQNNNFLSIIILSSIISLIIVSIFVISQLYINNKINITPNIILKELYIITNPNPNMETNFDFVIGEKLI